MNIYGKNLLFLLYFIFDMHQQKLNAKLIYLWNFDYMLQIKMVKYIFIKITYKESNFYDV